MRRFGRMAAWALALAAAMVIPKVAHADGPPPWAVCDGKNAGDPCGGGEYYPGDVCEPHTGGGCDTDASTCLWCVPPPGDAGTHSTSSAANNNNSGGCSAAPIASATGLLGLAMVAFALRRRKKAQRA